MTPLLSVNCCFVFCTAFDNSTFVDMQCQVKYSTSCETVKSLKSCLDTYSFSSSCCLPSTFSIHLAVAGASDLDGQSNRPKTNLVYLIDQVGFRWVQWTKSTGFFGCVLSCLNSTEQIKSQEIVYCIITDWTLCNV